MSLIFFTYLFLLLFFLLLLIFFPLSMPYFSSAYPALLPAMSFDFFKNHFKYHLLFINMSYYALIEKPIAYKFCMFLSNNIKTHITFDKEYLIVCFSCKLVFFNNKSYIMFLFYLGILNS